MGFNGCGGLAKLLPLRQRLGSPIAFDPHEPQCLIVPMGAGFVGHEVGRGLIAYDAEDADKIKGRSSADVLLILGFEGRTEMIHRDDLVLGINVSPREFENADYVASLLEQCRSAGVSPSRVELELLEITAPVNATPVGQGTLPRQIK